MNWKFSNKKLEQLYTTGKSKKYQMLKKSEVIDFVWLVDVIAAAKDIYDFWKQPSLNFEKLQGYTNRFSLRLTRVYRLEVTIEWENEKKTVGLVGIEEISKHYQ